jgi:hypothetical protein
MAVPEVATEHIKAHFDEEKRIIFVAYYGILSPEVTIQFYQWRAELVAIVDVRTIQGTVVDFREVTSFPVRNLTTVYKESRNANHLFDMSHIPVAMIVRTSQQDQSVRATMQVTPQQNRRRIVNSPESALAFIDAWHRARNDSAALDNQGAP